MTVKEVNKKYDISQDSYKCREAFLYIYTNLSNNRL